VATLDPAGTDAALRRMVVVGHSQGGLLTKLLAVDSADAFWRQVSRKPLEALDLDDETRSMLRRSVFVEPSPFVKRVVFLATPQHGSYLAGNWLAHQVARLIAVPSDLVSIGTNLLRNREALIDPSGRFASSVANMTPGKAFIHTLASIPIAPGIAAHSISAVKGDGPIEDGDDGVVEYRSAHIDGVESELVVRSPHSCQDDPHTIDEVRRIVLRHLGGG
jgi:pimeloyl-ACP methyl ester carboxylesterase